MATMWVTADLECFHPRKLYWMMVISKRENLRNSKCYGKEKSREEYGELAVLEVDGDKLY